MICIYIDFLIFIFILVDEYGAYGGAIYDYKFKDLIDSLLFIIIAICFIFITLYLIFVNRLELKKLVFFRQERINLLEWIWIILFECLIFNGISGSFCWYLVGTALAIYASQIKYIIIVIFCFNLFDGFKETMQDLFRKFAKLDWLQMLVIFMIYAFSFSVWT